MFSCLATKPSATGRGSLPFGICSKKGCEPSVIERVVEVLVVLSGMTRLRSWKRARAGGLFVAWGAPSCAQRQRALSLLRP